MSAGLEQNFIQSRKAGFTVPLELRAKDQEGVVFEMMTTVGAKVAEAITNEWRHNKRNVAINITVTMEEIQS